MIYLALLGLIVCWALIIKGLSVAYWRGYTSRIEISESLTDSYVEFIREVTEGLEQNDNLHG